MWVETVSRRAFCVTFRARHEELGRTVLIKALKPTVSVSSPFSQGLVREARVLSSIRHDSVVALYDFVRTADSMWLVLEDVRGHTLAEVMARARRLGTDAAAAIGLEVSRGLGHAHERGIVHRDLRPENVRLTAEGGVKVMEFGAAQDGRQPSAPEPFEPADMLAMPGYMAPEQILGEAVGPRTDVFSVGVMLYEMLAGEHPFEGRGGKEGGGKEGRDQKDVAHRIRLGEVAPLGVVAPEVPRDLERVVMRSLARDPEDRFESARAVAAALEEVLAARPRVAVRVLVSRALAAARLGEELPGADRAAAVERAEAARRPSLGPALQGFAAICAMIVAGGAVIEMGLREEGSRTAAPPVDGVGAPTPERRGYLRVLARPWAEVLVNGELVDTTPVGRPIPVPPGRHYVTFRHPNAPDEKRSIMIASGQTVVLDVTMQIDRAPVPDAGAGAAEDAGSP